MYGCLFLLGKNFPARFGLVKVCRAGRTGNSGKAAARNLASKRNNLFMYDKKTDSLQSDWGARRIEDR